MLECKPKPTSKHTHKGLTTEEMQLINVHVCACVCVCVCVCVWTRKREGDWGWKDDHVWTQPRVAGIAHGSPVFWRSWPGRPWKMAEPLGIIWETWWVCIGARNPRSRIPGESQLLLCDTKWLDLKLYWCFSSFNLLRFLLKLVGEGPEGFGGKRKHFREGNAKRGGLLGGKTFIMWLRTSQWSVIYKGGTVITRYFKGERSQPGII